jgi:hypothetical protein
MANTNFGTGSRLGASFTTTGPTANARVGDVTDGNNGSRWMYVVAQSAITAGDTVKITASTFTAASITAALAVTAGFVGFAQVAFITSDFGWVMIMGKPVLRLAASCADDVPLYTTDTAGVLDDATASLSHHQVMGVQADNSASAGGITLVTAFASWPVIRRPQA